MISALKTYLSFPSRSEALTLEKKYFPRNGAIFYLEKQAAAPLFAVKLKDKGFIFVERKLRFCSQFTAGLNVRERGQILPKDEFKLVSNFSCLGNCSFRDLG